MSLDGVVDVDVARPQLEDLPGGGRCVEQGDEDRSRVVAGDLGALDRRRGQQDRPVPGSAVNAPGRKTVHASAEERIASSAAFLAAHTSSVPGRGG